jgi:hypothetical protein
VAAAISGEEPVSIDANVTGISYLPDGTARLALEQPDRTRDAGQDALTVLNMPEGLELLLGRHVWGGADTLMCGEIKIGERVGCTRCLLHERALAQVEASGAGLPRG